MIKRYVAFVVAGALILFTSGCNLIALALSAGAAYGMSLLLNK